jgi:hypothetical protein
MRMHVVGGAVVWAVVAGVAAIGVGPFWVLETMFLLAPLVLVPQLLDLLHVTSGGRAAAAAGGAAALGAAASFLLPRGPASAALAVGWMVYVAALAAHRLLRGRWDAVRDPAERIVTVALAFLPIGAGWLVLSRGGVRPLGFEEPLVLLTAIHFHFAGFTAAALVGRAGREWPGSRAHAFIATGVAAGTPILAAGITLSPALEVAGAALLAASLVAFALWQWRRLSRLGGAARALLAVSAACLLPSMAAAVAYAVGEWTEKPILALSWMARVHGPLNALGFGLLGVLGWTVAPRNLRPISR